MPLILSALGAIMSRLCTVKFCTEGTILEDALAQAIDDLVSCTQHLGGERT